MSTTPILEPPPPPPPMNVNIQQEYNAHSGHGSVGPVIAVLAVIALLAAIAIVIGRLCSGRRIMGHGQYDFEGWVETKCASCLDGRVDHPSPPPSAAENIGGNGSPAVAVPIETPQDMKEEEIPQQSTQQPTRES